MTHDEMIAVLVAHRDGKVIQREDKDTWRFAPNPTWNFGSYNYRVKPEPRVVFINEYAYGLGVNHYKSKNEAKESAGRHSGTVKFIEVFE